MRVLVTGAAGFLGSHVVDRLLADGHEVAALDDLSTGRLDRLAAARTAAGFSLHRMSTLDEGLGALVARARPDVVVHAALTRGEPTAEVRAHTVGSCALAEAAAEAGADRLVLLSDAAVYGRVRGPVSERAGHAPVTPYAGARAAEAVLLRGPVGPPVTTLLLSRVYGPRQETGAVAMMARALGAGRPGTVFGDGTTVRDWLFVDDAVDAVVRCLDGAADGRRLNVGSGRGVTTDALHEAVAQAAGVRREPDRAPGIPGELASLVLEVGAARRALGWEPFTALPDGLRATLAALVP